MKTFKTLASALVFASAATCLPTHAMVNGAKTKGVDHVSSGMRMNQALRVSKIEATTLPAAAAQPRGILSWNGTKMNGIVIGSSVDVPDGIQAVTLPAGSAPKKILSWNGLKLNGLFANGLFANGLKQNGLFPNGLFPNGLFPNGTLVNRDAAESRPIAIVAVTLPVR